MLQQLLARVVAPRRMPLDFAEACHTCPTLQALADESAAVITVLNDVLPFHVPGMIGVRLALMFRVQ